MRTPRAVLALTCAAALGACCCRAGAPGAGLVHDVDSVLRSYEAAWQARDEDALAALFTEDGYVLSSKSPPVRGRDAIRAHYADAGGPLWLRALEARVDGEVGYVVGVYGHAVGAPETGKFVLALRRQGGRWLIAADIDNGNTP